MTRLEMDIDADALCRTLSRDLFVRGRIVVIDLREKTLKYEMPGFLAAGEFLA